VFNVTAVDTFLRLNRLQWAGHVVRIDDSTIPIKVTGGCFGGRRPVGSLEIDGRILFGAMP
jgi:hypothetical protein